MDGLSLELQRFVIVAASADVVVLELEGRFHADGVERLGQPMLVVETGDEALEAQPVGAPEATAVPGGAAWRASFAVPARAVAGATFALSVRRSMLVELPAPHTAPDDGGHTERHVRLARELNAQRHRADAAAAASTAAEARAADERAARELAQADAAELQAQCEELAGRLAAAQEEQAQQLAEAQQQLAEAQRQLAAAHEQHAQRLTAAQDQHAAEVMAEREHHAAELTAAQEQHARRLAVVEEEHAARLAAVEEQHAGARRALRELRAELESGRPVGERTTHPPPRRAAPDEPTAPVPTADPVTRPVERYVAPPGESVRVLGGTRRRRRAEDETAPSEPLPGTAEIGARHIEPGVTGAHAPAVAWLARGLALAAIAVVVVALILVLRPG